MGASSCGGLAAFAGRVVLQLAVRLLDRVLAVIDVTEPLPELANRPRKLHPKDTRPIVAFDLTADEAVFEGGELVNIDTLLDRIGPAPAGGPWCRETAPEPLESAILIGDDGLGLLDLAVQRWGSHSRFHFQMIPRHPEWDDDETVHDRPANIRFGFHSRGTGRRPSRSFQIIEPARFSDTVSEMLGDTNVTGLLTFGKRLRSWCNRRRLPVGSSAAAIASAILKDPRLTQPKRKVPRATNDRAREHLPGNHYRLLGSSSKRYPEIRQLDLKSAHHRSAMMIDYPHPDTLYAHGWGTEDLSADGQDATDWFDGLWWWRRSAEGNMDAFLDRHAGLFCVVLHVDHQLAADPLAPPCCARPGYTYRYIWSSELGFLRSLPGLRIVAVVASWSSPDRDETLNHTALWALQELEQTEEQDRPWVKPTLLAAYGLLACRPRAFRVIHKTAVRGKTIAVPTSDGREIIGVRCETKVREMNSVNVIARGLIEAHTRARVLIAARQLREQGRQVVCVWADGIFLIEDGTNPCLEPAWRDEGVLTDVSFESASHVVCDQFAKLPGLTGLQRAYAIKHRRLPKEVRE